jgi:hypothetical protein
MSPLSAAAPQGSVPMVPGPAFAGSGIFFAC